MDNSLKHLAVVIDGLDRGSPGDRLSLPEAGAEALRILLRVAADTFRLLPGIIEVSLFSPEFQAWARSPSHAPELYSLCRPVFLELDECARVNGAALSFVGRPAALPDPWPAVLSLAAPRPTLSRRVNFFFNYSSREEMTEAAERCLAGSSEDAVTEETFTLCLATAGHLDPDLVLYAGGELEPKDFLLWQASYAEIWYSPGDCRRFSDADLIHAVESFSLRHRRFGRV